MGIIGNFLDLFFRSPLFTGISTFMFCKASFNYAQASLSSRIVAYKTASTLFSLLNALAFTLIEYVLFQGDHLALTLIDVSLLLFFEALLISKDHFRVYIFLLLGVLFVLTMCSAQVLVLIGLSQNDNFVYGNRAQSAVMAVDGFVLLAASGYLTFLTHSRHINMDNWKKMLHSPSRSRILFFYFIIFDIAMSLCIRLIEPTVYYNDHGDPVFRYFMFTMLIITFTLMISSFLIVYTSSRSASFQFVNDDLGKEAMAAHRVATRDPLTGILNRRGFEETMEDLLCGKNPDPGVMFMLDLDNFKTVNDRLGHPEGDKLLKDVADDLSNKLFRTNDLVARLGGDEFIIFAPSMKAHMIASRANDIIKTVTRDIESHDFWGNIHISTSVGIACFPEDGTDYNTLYSKADKALYLAKHAGKGTFKRSPD